ncbi:MAG: hypothetical protein ACRD2S_03195, partial [Terriglobales bacterium]
MQSFVQARKSFRIAVILVGLLLSLSLGSSAAQTNPSSAVQNSDSQTDTQTGSSNLANGSRKTANEDEQAEFKHSGSVRLVARLTGLSLDQAYWLCVLLNFAIIVGAIIWASRKHLPKMFRNRTASIQHAIAEARKTSEEAKHRLADIEDRLSLMGTEIEEIRDAGEKEASDEESRTKA